MVRPSLTVGLYGMSRCTAALYSGRLEKPRLIDRGPVFGHLVGQPLERVGGDFGHLADAVLVPLIVHDLLVEDCQANWCGCSKISRPYLA